MSCFGFATDDPDAPDAFCENVVPGSGQSLPLITRTGATRDVSDPGDLEDDTSRVSVNRWTDTVADLWNLGIHERPRLTLPLSVRDTLTLRSDALEANGETVARVGEAVPERITHEHPA